MYYYFSEKFELHVWKERGNDESYGKKQGSWKIKHLKWIMDGFHLQCKAFSQIKLFSNQRNNVIKLSFQLKHIIVVLFVINMIQIPFVYQL